MPETPLHQPPIESLRNALQIAELWYPGIEPERDAYADIARLIRDALDKLSEPHPATIAAARKIANGDAYTEGEVSEREARDIAAVVTRTALTWEGGLR